MVYLTVPTLDRPILHLVFLLPSSERNLLFKEVKQLWKNCKPLDDWTISRSPFMTWSKCIRKDKEIFDFTYDVLTDLCNINRVILSTPQIPGLSLSDAKILSLCLNLQARSRAHYTK